MRVATFALGFCCWLPSDTRESHQPVASADLEVLTVLLYADRLDLEFSSKDSTDSRVLSTSGCVSCWRPVSKNSSKLKVNIASYVKSLTKTV